jgi:hypothetical protein
MASALFVSIVSDSGPGRCGGGLMGYFTRSHFSGTPGFQDHAELPGTSAILQRGEAVRHGKSMIYS